MTIQSNTRDRLVQAAADVLFRRGYQVATVDEICEAAGARKGSFYHFFPSKVDVAIAAVQLEWRRVEAQLFTPIDQDAPQGLDRLGALVVRLDAHRRERPGSAFGLIGQEMSHHEPRIRAAVAAVFAEQCRYFERWLDEAVAARQVRDGDNALRARQLLALIEGALLLDTIAADPGSLTALCEALPLVAGAAARSSRPAIGTAPELV